MTHILMFKYIFLKYVCVFGFHLLILGIKWHNYYFAYIYELRPFFRVCHVCSFIGKCMAWYKYVTVVTMATYRWALLCQFCLLPQHQRLSKLEGMICVEMFKCYFVKRVFQNEIFQEYFDTIPFRHKPINDERVCESEYLWCMLAERLLQFSIMSWYFVVVIMSYPWPPRTQYLSNTEANILGRKTWRVCDFIDKPAPDMYKFALIYWLRFT